MNFLPRFGLTLAINDQGQTVARIFDRETVRIYNAITTGRKVVFAEGMNFQARIGGRIIQTETLDEITARIEEAEGVPQAAS